MTGVSKSTIERLMKREKTKKPGQPGMTRVQLDDLKWFEHIMSVQRVYWLKGVWVEEDHESVVIDLASGSDCISDTDTARKTEGM